MNENKLPYIDHDRAVRALVGLKEAFEAEDEDIHACIEWALREVGLVPSLEEKIKLLTEEEREKMLKELKKV